jgi:fucose 4-O-acetylase-like acetyltransferase
MTISTNNYAKSLSEQTVEQRNKRASKAAVAGLLNLTFLPIIGFIWLLLIAKTVDKGEIDDYHAKLAIKINIIAAIALLFVSVLMIAFGGLDSVYTWVYVITYFTLVHTAFIVTATWSMVRAWAGQKFDGS